jgi:thiamine biosynthesis lipoprotein
MALLLLLAVGSFAEERFTFTEQHMGTQFRLVFYAADESVAREAARAAFARIAQLDGIMSDYRPTSELMQLCKRAGGAPVKVSDDLWTVLVKAQDVARRSDGAFDVTVGPLVKLWRRARRTQQLPAEAELQRARDLVGIDKLRLHRQEQSVQLLKAGMLLDLGGIAKGYTADEVLKTLAQRGIRRALVAAGGDVAVSEPPPGSAGWSIAIAPLEAAQQPERPLLLKQAAVSTSGDAEQFVDIGGVRYSHIVDPHTGLGLVGRMSATVVARHGIDADSLTKVVAILGAERGLALVDELPEVAARLVTKTEKGEQHSLSRRFRTLPRAPAADPGRKALDIRPGASNMQK